jgi:hypothetical protein
MRCRIVLDDDATTYINNYANSSRKETFLRISSTRHIVIYVFPSDISSRHFEATYILLIKRYVRFIVRIKGE